MTDRTIEDLVRETYTGDSLETKTGHEIWDLLNRPDHVFSRFDKVLWIRDAFRVVTTAAPDPVRTATYKPTLKAATSTRSKGVVREYPLEYDVEGEPVTPEDHYKFIAADFARELQKIFFTNTSLAQPLSIEQVLTAETEINNCPGSFSKELYHLKRAPWMDAYVNHNSGKQREFSLTLVDELSMAVKEQRLLSDRDTVIFITGHDTAEMWANIGHEFDMYFEYHPQELDPTENPAHMFLYKGVPVFPYVDVIKDGLSRIYLISCAHFFIKFSQLPIVQRFPDKISISAHYEIICPRFVGHGKLRDLCAPATPLLVTH